jgi:quinol-cytochrome oxidoreductase complex cytochrome b subunit
MKQNSAEPRKALLEHNTHGMLAIAGWFLAFIVAAFIFPNEPGEPLVGIVRAAASPVQSIEAYAQLSMFPDKTRLLLLLAWFGVPIGIALTYRSVHRMLRVEWLRDHKLAGAILVIAMFGTAALVLLNVPTAADLADRDLMGRMLRRMSTSRLALGIVAATWSFALGFGLAVAVATIGEFLSPRAHNKRPYRK